MRFQDTPFSVDQNDGNHVFVFGSNLAGRHGKGAALEACLNWGAKYRFGEGLHGCSYAIPTKDVWIHTLPMDKVFQSTVEFKRFAAQHTEITFLVTRVGCGLAGYKDAQIATLFKNSPDNCVFQKEWKPYLT